MTLLQRLGTLSLLLTCVTSTLTYLDPTTHCNVITRVGQTCCCNGATAPANQPLTCGSFCQDMTKDFVCLFTQTLRYIPNKPYEKYITTGKQMKAHGTCYTNGQASCPWTATQYRYKCCDCPRGYLTDFGYPNCDQYGSSPCVGCNSTSEVLFVDDSAAHDCRTFASCNLNANGRALILNRERFKPNIYYDSAGHRTIGWGHNCDAHKDCNKFAGRTLELYEADDLFKADVAETYGYIRRFLPNLDGMNTNQFAALLSYAFNCGPAPGNFRDLKPHLQNRDYVGFCNAITTTSKCRSGGPGIIPRREEEKALCLLQSTVKSGCS